MEKFSVEYIDKILKKIEIRIDYNIRKGRYKESINYIKASSFLRYKFHIGFKNDFIEDAIKHLSTGVKQSNFVYNNIEKSIVIIDNICTDRVGLIYQYISALINDGFSILYIYKNEYTPVRCGDIMGLLKKSNKAHIINMSADKGGMELIQWLYETICEFGATKMMMHLSEWSVEENIAASALPDDIIRYRINLADHTYWTGNCCIDYIFDFRHYGCNLSLHERGINKQHILYMPFYPVMEKHTYKGIPKEAEGKFIFFAGGAFYKVVDNEKTFFRLCKAVLDNCPNAVILFATGEGGETLLNIIKEFQLQNRLLPIGYRNDIYELFKRCDVFINTYPIGGGLMCQYAAQLSCPILNYKKSEIEEVISQKSETNFTFYSEDSFVEEAKKMYSDITYRKKCGDRIHNAVITKDDFEKNLVKSILYGKSCFAIKWEGNFSPSYCSKKDAIDYFNYKKNMLALYYEIYKFLGFSLFFICPMSFISLQYVRIKNKINKIIMKR